MMVGRPVQDQRAHSVHGVDARWIFLLLGLCLFSSCANEENLRKSKGFYQEGVARLNSDQQQAYVSFQKAVKLNVRCRPSGDQEGESSIPDPVVTCTRFCPSGDTIQSLYNRCGVRQT